MDMRRLRFEIVVEAPTAGDEHKSVLKNEVQVRLKRALADFERENMLGRTTIEFKSFVGQNYGKE